ncbi:MAG: PAS domain S-box protein, partial [Vicinamibacteria bacterium]
MSDAAELRRLAALAEYTTDAVVLVDNDGVVQWASPATLDVLGYAVDALVGTKIRDLLSPEDLDTWQALVERVRASPNTPLVGKYRCRHEDGSWRRVEGVVRNLLDDPRVGGIVVTYHDITALEAAEQEQRDRDARYRRLVTEAPDVIVETDVEGYLQWVNPAGLRLMGFTPDQVVNRRFTEFIREDYRPAVFTHYRRQIENGQVTSYIEFPVVGADGRELWLGQNAWLTLEDGRCRGMQAVARNITDRMRLEEQLLRARQMEAVGRLAGGIAHDFNNLLAAIRGNAELLHYLTKGDPKFAAELEEIQSSADRAAALTRQLLAFSRKHTIQSTPLDVGTLLTSAEPMLRRLAGAGIALSLEVAPQTPAVLADADSLEQVLLNLVSNARDAVPAGGVVRVSAGPARLEEGRAETGRAALAAAKVLGEARVIQDSPPIMGGEDFSFMLLKRPGCFV